MASRFWAGSSSEEDELSNHSEISDMETNTTNKGPLTGPAGRWAVDSDSESEDEIRTVKSTKDKAYELLEKSCNHIKNSIKTNDWSNIVYEFNETTKYIEKAKITKYTNEYPLYYLKIIILIEDTINNHTNDKIKMNKENNKSFIKMKGKIKKIVDDLKNVLDPIRQNIQDNRDNENEISEEEDSDENEDEEESDEDSDKDSNENEHSSSEEEEEDEEDEEETDDERTDEDVTDKEISSDESWPSESESETESESEDDGQLKGRAKWLKQVPLETKNKKEKGPKVPKTQKLRKNINDINNNNNLLKKQKEQEELKLTPSQFDRRLLEVLALRGKKGIESNQQINELQKLAAYSPKIGISRQVVCLMHLISTQLFDSSSNMDKILSIKVWLSTLSNLNIVLTLLENNKSYNLIPFTSEDHADIIRIGKTDILNDTEINENDINNKIELDSIDKNDEKNLKVSGDLVSFIERLSDEYIKSLRQLDPHTIDYINRLFDEGLLIECTKRVQKYLEYKKEYNKAATMALICIEYTYYKHDSIAKSLHISQLNRKLYGNSIYFHPACKGVNHNKSNNNNNNNVYNYSIIHPASIQGEPKSEIDLPNFTMLNEIKELCLFVYKYADDRRKTRGMLCSIYYHALHDRFHEARDLLLMSRLQDTIIHADISTQILFNRSMAQLGLCGFRNGYIIEAHSCLSEICSGTKTKEYLAQGIQSHYRNLDKDIDQEKLEKRRQMPYHMHINLELLECCHLLCGMLLEVPYIVSFLNYKNINQSNHTNLIQNKKKIISKTFRRILDYHERLVFLGPPENTRDYIVLASKSLAKGKWKEASNYITNLSIWDLFPGPNVSTNVKNMIIEKIKIESLRAYLLMYINQYTSIHLSILQDKFLLTKRMIYNIISKMILSDELVHVSWNETIDTLLIKNPMDNNNNNNNNELCKLHLLAIQYADKAQIIIDNHTKMIDNKSVQFDNNNNNNNNTNWNRRDKTNQLNMNDNNNNNNNSSNYHKKKVNYSYNKNNKKST